MGGGGIFWILNVKIEIEKLKIQIDHKTSGISRQTVAAKSQTVSNSEWSLEHRYIGDDTSLSPIIVHFEKMTLPRDPSIILRGRHPEDGSRLNKRRGHVDDSHEAAPSFWRNATHALHLPVMRSLRAVLGITIALYILNQKHMLPRPLSAVVSKTLFWPTLPITVGRRLGRWHTVVDDTVIMGGAPIGFARLPESLKEQYGVSVSCVPKK